MDTLDRPLLAEPDRLSLVYTSRRCLHAGPTRRGDASRDMVDEAAERRVACAGRHARDCSGGCLQMLEEAAAFRREGAAFTALAPPACRGRWRPYPLLSSVLFWSTKTG